MSYENVLFRSFRGIVFISITPFILLTASLWFSSDETAFILAHVSQVYFSILLFFLAGIIWGMRASQNKEQTELLLIAFVPILDCYYRRYIKFLHQSCMGSRVSFANYLWRQTCKIYQQSD